MEAKKSKSVIAYGFAIIMVLVVVLIVVWVNSVSENKAYLQFIQQNQDELYNVTSLLDKVNLQTSLLYQIVNTREANVRVGLREKLQKNQQETARILSRMDALLPVMVQPTLWQKTKALYQDYAGLVSKLLQAAPGGERQVIFSNLIPVHNQVVAALQAQLESYKNSSRRGLASAISRNNDVYYMIVVLGAVALLLGLLNILVVRQTQKNEAMLYEQGARIRELYEISAKPGLSIEEQIREILKLGCRLMGMEIGKVCQIDKAANTNSFLNVYAPEGFSVCAGTVMPLDKTFCSITTTSDEPIMLHDVANSPYGKQFSHLAAYIATSITVHGKDWGSINFSANKPRAKPFTKADRDLMKMIGAWISSALERRFAQEELLIAKNEAEAASRTKSAFLANMSHELRTPLNAIIGYSELLKEEAEFNQHDMYEQDLHKINSSALHLLALIDDILDLSKIEAGKMEFYLEDFPVEELLADVQATVEPLAQKKHNTFTLEKQGELGIIHSDKLKVKQVLFNLLSNASKFTENGSIKLTAARAQDRDNPGQEQIIFTVEDTGIGISDEQISKIFQAFSQADASTTSKYGGTGLGLAISRQICQLMGGDILVKGAIGQGSTFTVKLPVRSQVKKNIPS